ncbi:MAG: hypothetical protein HQ567_10380 [Candidatus Nealsonbacteria bacterium]|nr:hypothetical protein [Candidatus Nealsonbacteria bacterium]
MSEEVKAASSENCPICSFPVERSAYDERDVRHISCRCCGTFCVTKEVDHFLMRVPDRDVLSGVTRHHYERTGQALLITEKNFEDLKNSVPDHKDVSEKTRRLLLALADRTATPGKGVDIRLEFDCPLAYCRGIEEFKYYLNHLSERRLTWSEGTMHSETTVTVSPEGWDAVEEWRSLNAESEKVFVAMWFDEKVEHVYTDGIKPAIEDDCGYKATRIDMKDYVGDIVDEMIAEIRESRFIVADFTGQRHGVYYEAGYALGLGLPVVSTCRKDDIGDLHFDTNHQNHIVWETAEELRERLANRIRAVIGIGPKKKG